MSAPLRVLVAGGAGQVGRELRRLDGTDGFDAGGAPVRVAVTALGRTALDVTGAASVEAAFAAHRPDAVVNAAAYTAVDRAEAERDAAFAVNAGGPRRLAAACAASGVPLVQISTDYVFDGSRASPYPTTAAPTPVNAYGASKAAGEAEAGAAPTSVVVRTAWVLSGHSPGFVRTMLRLAAERAPGGPNAGEPLRVVDDQWGHPTPASAVAWACLQAATRLARGSGRERLAARSGGGRHHVAGEPLTTWCRLAREIVAEAVRQGAAPVPVQAIPTSAYPTPARRPARVELELEPSRRALGLPEIRWREALPALVREALRHA